MANVARIICAPFFALARSPAFDGVQQRTLRRWLASYYVVAAMAMPLVFWSSRNDVALVLLGFNFLVAAVLLAGSIRGLTDLPTRHLDEYQVQLRNDAFRHAYWLAVILGLAGGWLVGELWGSDQDLAFWYALGIFGLLAGLPSVAVAWQMPDEDLEDE